MMKLHVKKYFVCVDWSGTSVLIDLGRLIKKNTWIDGGYLAFPSFINSGFWFYRVLDTHFLFFDFVRCASYFPSLFSVGWHGFLYIRRYGFLFFINFMWIILYDNVLGLEDW